MHHIDDLTNGKPTGYSFTYSSNQNLSTSTTGFNEEHIILCDYENKNDAPNTEIQLLKEVLHILGKLNAVAIAPYYEDFNISGIVRIMDDTTDIMLCDDSDTSNWSFLHPASQNGILITQHTDLSTLAATGTPCHIHNGLLNPTFQFTLQAKAEGPSPSEPGHSVKETHYLIAPDALQNYLLNAATEEMQPDPEEINTILKDIKTLIRDIQEQDIIDNSLTERAVTVRQKVEQLTRMQ